MWKKALLLLFISIMFYSCSDDDTSDGSPKVQIRLSNNSDVKLENMTFNGVNYGTLDPNEKSPYKPFENAYSYGAVSIDINGENYGWMPIDYVGETPLETGNYTFQFDFDIETKVLTDQLIRD